MTLPLEILHAFSSRKTSGRPDRNRATSLLYWYPKVKDLAPTPRTIIVKTPTPLMGMYLESGPALPGEFVASLYTAGDEIGYPLFLRTDLVSAKFDWNTTCCVPSRKSLLANVYRILEFAECVSLVGLPTWAFVFRGLLKLDSDFNAFREMPVAKERRYFVRDGKVQCHHSYWCQQAILKWALGKARFGIKTGLPINWKELLEAKNKETPEEVKELTALAEKVGGVLGGYWSIDFAWVPAREEWFLIDAAMGIDSTHPSICPQCPEEVRAEMKQEEE